MSLGEVSLGEVLTSLSQVSLSGEPVLEQSHIGRVVHPKILRETPTESEEYSRIPSILASIDTLANAE